MLYLGTHMTSWLEQPGPPLFVSHRRLALRSRLPVAACRWALDSGGFTELRMFGEWRTTPAEYALAVRRYHADVGLLDWCAPQDWMVEPFMLKRTGLSVAEHQRRTVENFVELRAGLGELVIPVLQGWTRDDYDRCWELYDKAGVELADERLVGVGSICRRDADRAIARVVDGLARRGVPLHGFGVRGSAFVLLSGDLATADSMAWSYQARRRKIRLPGCAHARCSNCRRYALRWHARLERLAQAPQHRQLLLVEDL